METTDVAVEHLSSLTVLTVVDLDRGDKVTDECLASLATLTSLKNLRLHKSSKITDVGVEHLSSLTALATVDLTLCFEIAYECLPCLSTLTSLGDIRL